MGQPGELRQAQSDRSRRQVEDADAGDHRRECGGQILPGGAKYGDVPGLLDGAPLASTATHPPSADGSELVFPPSAYLASAVASRPSKLLVMPR